MEGIHIKTIKDAVHGYIKIDKPFDYILDTPEFQRLRWMEQSSFRVLYPAARHDRFIHSLGTYHLASIFIMGLYKNLSESLTLQSFNDDEREKLKLTFCYAALLHDIGHAPFSHTCEKFFTAEKDDEGTPNIFNDLCDALHNSGSTTERIDRFKYEYTYAEAKPHEIVSALILVQKAEYFLDRKYLAEINLELAARMVLGVTYRLDDIDEENESTHNELLGVYNCVIRLLNSKTVDVDKLDYLSRDTYMSGFESVSIDLIRLASSVTAICDKNNGDVLPAFKKSALSVIDNVFKAKNAQSQWIIQHPIVVYEQFLLQNYLDSKSKDLPGLFNCNNLFLPEQKPSSDYFLLSDIDILNLIKSDVYNSPQVMEYFNRGLRRNSLWKSYFEFKYYFGEENSKKIMNLFEPLFDYIDKQKIYNITENTLSSQRSLKKVQTLLNRLVSKHEIGYDFVIIKVDTSFSSSANIKNINIQFPVTVNDNNYIKYSDLLPSKGKEEDCSYFYLYTKEKISPDKTNQIITSIVNFATQNTHENS